MSRTWLVKLVSLSGGSLKTNFSTQYNICRSGKLVDQWSDYYTITSIKSKFICTIRFLERPPRELSKLAMRYIAIFCHCWQNYTLLAKLLARCARLGRTRYGSGNHAEIYSSISATNQRQISSKMYQWNLQSFFVSMEFRFVQNLAN